MDIKTLDTTKTCECGRLHSCVTEIISIGENQTEPLFEYIAKTFGSGKKGGIVCDQNTYEAAKGMIDQANKFGCKTIKLNIKSFHADEFMVEDLKSAIEGQSFDYFIAAGAGTLHDITRIVSHERNVPFVSYSTAPSVDGFVSGIVPITSKSGMKLTLYGTPPVALFADTAVLAAAPKRLVAAGAGDMLAKYIALADWQIASLLSGEYICPPTLGLVYGAVERTRASLAAYESDKSGESYKNLCAELLGGLVSSGLCMQYIGNSRPASGAEHHIAHFFEMGVILSTDCLHGENVGVGSALCAGLYHRFAGAKNIEFVENYEMDEMEHGLLKKYYANLYEDILKENEPNSIKAVGSDNFYGNIENIKSIIATIPTAEKLSELLDILGGAKDICDIGAYNLKCEEAEILPLTLKLAPYVRDRLTLLKLMRCVKF